MGYWYNRLAMSPNYVRRFGPLEGLRLLFQTQCKLSERPDTINKFRVPDYPLPIYLRDTVSDHAMFWQCIVQEQYNFGKFKQSARLLAAYNKQLADGATPLVIDCGGNIGLAAIYLSKIFPDANIYSLEPDHGNIDILELNIRNFRDRITPLHGGIWNYSTTLQITNPDVGACGFRVAEADKQQDNPITAYTINDVCDYANVKFPFAVKIDIEGAQRHLFKSNTDWVQECHLIMIELEDWLMPWQGTSRSFFSCMSRYPFEYLMSGETLFCFRDFES